MEKFKTKTVTKMSICAKKFVTEQLWENSVSMQVNICNELFVINISNALWPAEQRLNRRIEDLIIFNEFKTRQFEEVKDILKSEFEDLSGCKILKIESLLCKDNSRIIIGTFLNRVENEPKKN